MTNKRAERGLNQDEFAAKHDVLRDHHRDTHKLKTMLLKPHVAAALMLLNALGIWFSPDYWEVLAIVSLSYGCYIAARARRFLPMPHLLPRGAPCRSDPHLLKVTPQGLQSGAPSADMYLGIERQSHRQVWFRFSD